MYSFKVYDKRGKLKEGILAAYLQNFQLTREAYKKRWLYTAKGSFVVQPNPEIDAALERHSSVQVICSFQVHDSCRVAVCKLRDQRRHRDGT